MCSSRIYLKTDSCRPCRHLYGKVLSDGSSAFDVIAQYNILTEGLHPAKNIFSSFSASRELWSRILLRSGEATTSLDHTAEEPHLLPSCPCMIYLGSY